MIKLNTSSLREFQKRASIIERNTLLPVLANLKFTVDDGVCLATKSSVNAICIGDIKYEGSGALKAFLLDERILFSLLGNTSAEMLEITLDGGTFVLSDGRDKIVLPVEPPDNFPADPEYESEAESFEMNKKVIDAINIGRSFVVDSATAGSKQFVHMRGSFVFAVHDAGLYIDESFADLPLAMFTKEETAIITQHEKLKMAQTDRHHIFFAEDGFTFIFTKSEGNTLNAEGLLSRIKLPGKNIAFLKEEILNFCNLANTVSESPVATCTMSQEGIFLRLQMNDKSYGRGNHRLVVCEGECDEFNFNSRLLAPLFKAIPYEGIKAKTLQNNLILGNEGQWFCFIGMQKI